MSHSEYCVKKFDYEHICQDPKDGELCLRRAKSGETLMEAHSDTGDELYAYDVLFVLGKLMEKWLQFCGVTGVQEGKLFLGERKGWPDLILGHAVILWCFHYFLR